MRDVYYIRHSCVVSHHSKPSLRLIPRRAARQNLAGGADPAADPKEKETKRQKRDRKEKRRPHPLGGAVRGSEPEDELSGGGALHSEVESEGGRRPECLNVIGPGRGDDGKDAGLSAKLF